MRTPRCHSTWTAASGRRWIWSRKKRVASMGAGGEASSRTPTSPQPVRSCRSDGYCTGRGDAGHQAAENCGGGAAPDIVAFLEAGFSIAAHVALVGSGIDQFASKGNSIAVAL